MILYNPDKPPFEMIHTIIFIYGFKVVSKLADS